jgi:hypothetical protein
LCWSGACTAMASGAVSARIPTSGFTADPDKRLYVKQLRRWVTGLLPRIGALAGSSDTQSDQQSGEHIHITGLILPASSAGG